jgi:hypothetical protein
MPKMIPARHIVVTSKLTAQIQLEIEREQINRRKGFDEAIEELRAYVEQAFDADGPAFFELTHTLWRLLMLVGLRVETRA